MEDFKQLCPISCMIENDLPVYQVYIAACNFFFFFFFNPSKAA